MAMDDEPAPAVPCGKSPRVRRASGLHVSVVSSADDSDEESQEETSHVVARNARESSEGYSVARRSGGLAALTNEPHVNLCSSPTGNDDGASAPSSPSSRPLSSSSLALPSLPAGSPTAPVESAGLSQRVRCYSREDAAELLATLPPARLLPPRTTQALSKIISPTLLALSIERVVRLLLLRMPTPCRLDELKEATEAGGQSQTLPRGGMDLIIDGATQMLHKLFALRLRELPRKRNTLELQGNQKSSVRRFCVSQSLKLPQHVAETLDGCASACAANCIRTKSAAYQNGSRLGKRRAASSLLAATRLTVSRTYYSSRASNFLPLLPLLPF
eukprot:GHVT01014355.1.p1 GENE.GHVT01014355.1~~GHVT01014355.1.p1  ORF type:complete len:331 (+),score=79.22 GHVT01014355.1:490-1482(+)